MPSDQPPRDDKKKKNRGNPWGKPSGEDRGPWGGSVPPRGQTPPPRGPGRGAPQGPDLDQIFSSFQNNFRGALPPGLQGFPLSLAALGLIALLWLASGLFVVNPGENAVVQRFGAWTRTQAEPGLGYHLPVPIEKASVLNVQEIRRLSIGLNEAQVRSGAGDRRVLPEESLMLTSDRNILDLSLEVQCEAWMG